jgi:hypothetical protein
MNSFGGIDSLELAEVPEPIPAEGEGGHRARRVARPVGPVGRPRGTLAERISVPSPILAKLPHSFGL